MREWPDYVGLFGLTREDVPELVRIATDKSLSRGDSESGDVWSPLHAWRALAQLGAVEAVKPLLGLLHWIDDNQDDWVCSELPRVLGMLGHAAVPAVTEYLANAANSLGARCAAARALGEVAKRYPEARDVCVELLSRHLERYEPVRELNGHLVSELRELGGIEGLEVIREGFRRRVISCYHAGDLEDIEIAFGVRQQRTHLRRDELLFAPWRGASPPPIRQRPGRNDICPCGSGRKYKKCCLHKLAE